MTQQLLEQYNSLPDEAQRQVADFVAFLQQRSRLARAPRPAVATDLEKEPFIGMWKDREDLEDSTAWVRGMRNSEWSAK